MAYRLVGLVILFLLAACEQPAGTPLSKSNPGAGPEAKSQPPAVAPAETTGSDSPSQVTQAQATAVGGAEPGPGTRPPAERGIIQPPPTPSAQDLPAIELLHDRAQPQAGQRERQSPAPPDGGGPQVSIECGPTTINMGAFLYCGSQFQGSVETARWSAPGGSPSQGNGANFQTTFPIRGQKSIYLQACDQLGCVTASTEVQVVSSLDLRDTRPATERGNSGDFGYSREEGTRRGGSEPRWDGLYSLPQCSQATLLTVPPLDPDAYQVIIPLGLLTTPQHVLPTSHIYYQLKGQFKDDGVNPDTNPAAVADVRAPGNVRILGINYTVVNKDGALLYKDYDLYFAPCRDRLFELIHVSTLNPELTRLMEAAEPFQCDEYGSVEGEYRFCQTTVQLDITVGTVLGTTGGKVSTALDLEAYDLSSTPLAFANPGRYRSDLGLDRRLHITCPLDWFTAQARAEQIARIGGPYGQVRTKAPVCGLVMQDVPGTAQGNWFTGPLDRPANWAQEMALVHDHIDPSLAAISIGGTVMDMGVWLFLPEDGGLINREFSQVKPDGRVYCYQGAISSESGQEKPEFPGRLLIRMETKASMSVERQDGSCQNGLGFIDPVVYQR